MSNDKQVIINDQVVRVYAEDMSWERASRLGDCLSAVSEGVPQVTIAAGEFTAAWREEQAIELVGQGDEEALAQAIDEVGDPPVELLISVLFEPVWKIARDQIITALSVLTCSDAELFEAYNTGGDPAIEERLAKQAAMLRFAKMPDLLELAVEGVPAVMTQIESITDVLTSDAEDGGQGKATETSEEKSPDGDDEPSGSPKSSASTPA